MSTSNLQPDIGRIAEIGRLYPAVLWEEDPGAVANNGVLWEYAARIAAGIGNRIVIYPYWNLEALQAGPVGTDIKDFSISIWNEFRAPNPYFQGRDLSEDYSDFPRYFASADIQPSQDINVSQAVMHRVAWEGFHLPDQRTDLWPPEEVGGTSFDTFPILVTTSLAQYVRVIVTVNSVGGPDTGPVSREGEYFKAMLAIGGMSGTL